MLKACIRLAIALMTVTGVALPGTIACAGEKKAKGIEIQDAWTRATPKGSKVAAGYMSVRNKGQADDRLLSATADIADRVEIHEMKMANGVMSMRPLADGLVVSAGQTIKLEPGGYHIMFIGLKNQITKGDSFKGTIVFEKAGAIPVEYKAEAIGAKVHGSHGGHDAHHGHGDMKKGH